ncbi:unnamed protein product [Auanema sp. JU1783]|nr:unnamed protein product [Auanema sp. JU1783]
MKARTSNAAVLEQAWKNSRKSNSFKHGGYDFEVVEDHILESMCRHNEDASSCSKCLFANTLSLPELPEMVFPHNQLVISFSKFPGSCIRFNALDALKLVCPDKVPDIQVAPSVVWQESRKELQMNGQAEPYDWTFTTKYSGTVENCKLEPSEETIDMERLKRQDPIAFYGFVTLYEDELADHGCAKMEVRIRVMPTYFFVLVRFYLRVDRVLIRVCDTRLVGDNHANYMIREWSLREAKYEEVAHLPSNVLLDGNQVWQYLPVKEQEIVKIIPNA